MRNRNSITKKLEKLETKMVTLKGYVKTGEPINKYIQALEEGLELINEINDFIDREPIYGNELSK